MLKKLFKQRKIPFLGEFIDSFFTTLPLLSIYSSISVTVILYAEIADYLPSWMNIWIFIAIIGCGVLPLALFLTYKYVLYSLWSSRSKQMAFLDNKLDAIIKHLGIRPDQEIVVAVSGGFDPLNGKGHLTHIQEAKKLGTKLVVILSRDDQLIAKGNKPKGTFYPSYEEREAIIKELESVDEVVMNIDKDGLCADTLKMVRPQIFANGGDRKPDTMPLKELEVCKEIACEIVYNVGGKKTTSSSELIKRANVQ